MAHQGNLPVPQWTQLAAQARGRDVPVRGGVVQVTLAEHAQKQACSRGARGVEVRIASPLGHQYAGQPFMAGLQRHARKDAGTFAGIGVVRLCVSVLSRWPGV